MSKENTNSLDGWFYGTAKQYVVAPDGVEYWPRTEMNRQLKEAWERESAVATELKLAKQLLSRLSIRLNKQMNNALGSIQEDVALIREIEALLEPK